MTRHFISFEIKELEQNQNVLMISNLFITYHPEFKVRIVEAHEQGDTSIFFLTTCLIYCNC